jgi:hypothetical protein
VNKLFSIVQLIGAIGMRHIGGVRRRQTIRRF